MNISFARMQDAVRAAGLDAWLLFDFRRTNPLAWKMLGLADDAHCTRRWMIVIPANGPVVKIVHRMEQVPLAHVPAETLVYDTRTSWAEQVREATKGFTIVAMEYSPMGELPVVSKVDAGTIDFLRSLDLEVVSSADLLQEFTALLSPEQIAGNALTAAYLRAAVHDAFGFIRTQLMNDTPVTEYDVQQFIMDRFGSQDMITDTPPIVAIGPNAASPHYAPTPQEYSAIGRDMVVLIDAWARSSGPGSVYADITWVGYTGETVPSAVAERFAVLTTARDATLEMIRGRFAANETVYGYEVDRTCRTSIERAGYGAMYIHRTGHNITDEVHGPGANMDDFETHDTRRVLPGTSFSIEPGLYEDGVLGLRTELDVVIDLDGTVLVPSEPIQQAILPLLHPEGIPQA